MGGIIPVRHLKGRKQLSLAGFPGVHVMTFHPPSFFRGKVQALCCDSRVPVSGRRCRSASLSVSATGVEEGE